MGSVADVGPDGGTVETAPPVTEAGASTTLREPFPGPRPFREDERGLFYGRSKETAQLRSMVLASSLVLLYSASGAGKSSLIHAGLVPALRKRGATVFPVLHIRSSGDSEAAGRLGNPYVRGMACNWAVVADLERPLGEGRSHAEELTGVKDLDGLVGLLAQVYEAPVDRPRVLIIDQFEELFTFEPENWEKRGDVFRQLEQLVTAHPEMSILLSMREDYIAQTDPYAELVANNLQQRFRIETLREPQALQAVQGPLNGTGRTFAPGAAEALVSELLQIRIDRGRKDRKPDKTPGEYVEAVQLQVVCRRLWDALPKTVKEITTADVVQYANVDEALMRFYDDAVRAAAGADLRARERRIRRWIGDDLITAGETRGTSHRDAALKKHVPRAALATLVDDWHLLKTEWRNGSDWYEITHDRLIDPIRDSNRRYQERTTSHLRTAGFFVLVLLGLVATGFGLAWSSTPASTTSTIVRTATVPGAVVHVRSSSPVPPLIAVPVDGSLYRRGGIYRARYSCVKTAAWTPRRCRGNVGQRRPIDTRQLGAYSFQVTATYGRSAIVTSRRVNYLVVSFASSTFHGRSFTVGYPSDWTVQNAEVRERGGYTDTTIVSPSNPVTLLRVDVTPNPKQDPQTAVQAEVRAVSRERGYRQLALAPTRIMHTAAIDWRFTLPESRVRVEKEDVFFTWVDNSGAPEEIAMLTEAPVRAFGRLAGEFTALRRSLIVTSAYYGPDCGQPRLAAENYSMCQLTTGENCPTGFVPQAEADGTDVCLNKND